MLVPPRCVIEPVRNSIGAENVLRRGGPKAAPRGEVPELVWANPPRSFSSLPDSGYYSLQPRRLAAVRVIALR